MATFRRWWARARRKVPESGACAGQLREIAQRRGAHAEEVTMIEGDLKDWLASVGGPVQLNAEQARKWLGVWHQLLRAQREARCGHRIAGPDENRSPHPSAIRAGRAVIRRRGATGQTVLSDGTVLTDPVQIAVALIQTGEAIWFAETY